MAEIRQPEVTVGQAGAGAPMLQLSRSLEPEVTVGQAGAGAPMLQLSR
jgi:hypothetical protein